MFENKVNNQPLNISVSENTFMYFQKPFSKLNLSKFKFEDVKKKNFEILFMYSYDNKSWSSPREANDSVIDDKFKIWCCVWFRRINKNDLIPAESLYIERNVEVDEPSETGQILPHFECKSIKYDDKQILFGDVKFQEYFQTIDEFPRWNINDNQNVHVQRWLAQCNSIAEQYGHTVIWFKTAPVIEEVQNPTKRADHKQSGIHGTSAQLANHVIRNIVEIKRLHVLIPNNEIPQDRNVYSEWDLALQDDFVIHVVRKKFEQAFGENQIPEDKDFLYFPMLNKLYRVSTMQPKNGFMGVIGWYEVFLTKYEEDDSILENKHKLNLTIDKDLKDAVSGIPDMFAGLEELGPEVELQNKLWDEFSEMKEDTVQEETDSEVIKEQRHVTESYTNKLEDTTFYISLRETEKLRERYHKRLEIVSVNLEDFPFPVNMYDCSKVESHTIALEYAVTDVIGKLNKSNEVCKSYDFSFRFCITGICPNSEIFKLQTANGEISVNTKRYNLFLSDYRNSTQFDIQNKLDKSELYKLNVSYQVEPNIYVIKIFKLIKRENKQIYSEIFKLGVDAQDDLKLEKLQLFGGKFLISDVQLYIDGTQVLNDKCLPLLEMYKF